MVLGMLPLFFNVDRVFEMNLARLMGSIWEIVNFLMYENGLEMSFGDLEKVEKMGFWRKRRQIILCCEKRAILGLVKGGV